MVDKSRLIGRIFQAIANNDDEHYVWDLLEQITSDEGVVYMTYAGETPQSFAEKVHRDRLMKLIQLHRNLMIIRAQFSSGDD